LAGALSACGSATTTPGSGDLRVVATTTQLADFARNVGGDRVTVSQLLQPNVDPHEYEPTPGDVSAVSKAVVVIQQGVGLDDWLEPVLSNAGGKSTRIVASEGVPLLRGDKDEPAGDPHIWLDPTNAILMVRNVATGLATADPSGAATYQANADRYIAALQALDSELAARIATVPAASRKIVTDHDAFGYFAKHYGIQVIGTVIPSLSTAAEPDAKDLARLVATIRREHVHTVFPESSVNPRLQRAIAEESGATLGKPLYGDTLGPAGTPGATYLGMMRSNMDAIIAGIRSA
jgi:zinc/manganese transport system substrate-binding protein/manganese/iron transport system substrate-binding protein